MRVNPFILLCKFNIDLGVIVLPRFGIVLNIECVHTRNVSFELVCLFQTPFKIAKV